MSQITKQPTIISPYYARNVKFAKRVGDDFLTVVRQRVMDEFKRRKISPYANSEMLLKTLMVFTLYALCVIAIYSNYFSAGALLGIYAFLGFVCSLHGLNVAHDAMHGAYFRSPTLNKSLSYGFDCNCTSSFVWRVSHNTHHHIYTNIPGLDYDIDKGSLLRFQPTDPIYHYHYFQNWYALPLYSLMSLNWGFYSDIVWMVQEYRKGTVPTQEMALFCLLKLVHPFFLMILPMMLLSVPWWIPLIGYIILHAVSGVTSAIVFQLAHLVEGVEFVHADEGGELPYDWALHEMNTTSNFATKSRWVTFWVGGLNFQVEHHLFPEICHVHYFWISDIVRKTAEEFNFPYKENRTFTSALISHFRTLKKLGRNKDWNG